MKPKTQPTTAPTESATTDFERFRDFVKQVVSVPKEEIDKREAEYKEQRQGRKSGHLKKKIQP